MRRQQMERRRESGEPLDAIGPGKHTFGHFARLRALGFANRDVGIAYNVGDGWLGLDENVLVR